MFGFVSLLFLLFAGSEPKPSSPSPAALAFEKLKELQGDWDSYSTAGWTGRASFQIIARGSALVSTSQFEAAHPGETMLTVFHLDGDRLLLTHYCVARNQPRLEATGIEADLTTIRFTFRDGTNLPSRDTGHMDKAVYRFEGPDRFASRWTWYQKGKESWMEEIRYERHRPPGGQPDTRIGQRTGREWALLIRGGTTGKAPKQKCGVARSSSGPEPRALGKGIDGQAAPSSEGRLGRRSSEAEGERAELRLLRRLDEAGFRV